jgi:hypothetical protein
MAGAAARGMQDADVEPASNGFWIVDSVILNHLAVRCKIACNNDPLRGGFRVQ